MTELPDKIRAFIALPIPSTALAQIARIQAILKPKFRDVSWTRPKSMHLTLRFLGDVGSARVDGIIAALAEAAGTCQSFAVRIGGIGAFGNRVIWIGLRQGVEPLSRLESTIRSATRNLGTCDEREFNPHVTLGRLRQRGRGVAAKLRDVPPFSIPAWQATHIELIRSELSPNGSRYTVLGTFPLAMG